MGIIIIIIMSSGLERRDATGLACRDPSDTFFGTLDMGRG